MRIARVTKSEAARALGISRRSVIRYAKGNLISEDRRGRVLISETRRAWSSPSSRGRRSNNRPDQYGKVEDGKSAYALEKAQANFQQLEKEAKSLGKATAAARRAYVLDVIRKRARQRALNYANTAINEWTERQLEAGQDTDKNMPTQQLRKLEGGLLVLGHKVRKKLLQEASINSRP